MIPFTPAELPGTMNRACYPVTLRHSNRYSLPATTAVLLQEQNSFEATVINISEGGILCEIDFAEDYKWAAPVVISVTFRIEEEEFTARISMPFPAASPSPPPILTSPPGP